MGCAIVEEIATLASLALFLGMVAIWAQVIATLWVIAAAMSFMASGWDRPYLVDIAERAPRLDMAWLYRSHLYGLRAVLFFLEIDTSLLGQCLRFQRPSPRGHPALAAIECLIAGG
jgi:hypothetical protein